MAVERAEQPGQGGVGGELVAGAAEEQGAGVAVAEPFDVLQGDGALAGNVRRLAANGDDEPEPVERPQPSIATCMENLSRYLNGWMTHFRFCTSDAVEGLRVTDAHIRRRIRAIIVRHRKRSRFLFRHLLSKGVSRKAAAGCAYCGKGAWVKSNHGAMTRAYPPSWFTGRQVSLKARWRELNPPAASAQLSLAL